ncbi:MAG: prepilin-type N-terminal cleavage/methylation domain-containing protein [Myxococcota bacterium]
MTTSSATRPSGFTLLEVLAAVLVLGLLYTVLATAALRGLRSEGIDRRRAEAALLADARLGELEAAFAMGQNLDFGSSEEEVPPYTVRVEVLPEEVLSLLPAEVQRQAALEARETGLESLLIDERGQSRLQRIELAVEWDEAGEIYQVRRTTHGFDPASVAHLLQAQQAGDGGDAAGVPSDTGDTAGGDDGLVEALGGNVPPELQRELQGR